MDLGGRKKKPSTQASYSSQQTTADADDLSKDLTHTHTTRYQNEATSPKTQRNGRRVSVTPGKGVENKNFMHNYCIYLKK